MGMHPEYMNRQVFPSLNHYIEFDKNNNSNSNSKVMNNYEKNKINDNDHDKNNENDNSKNNNIKIITRKSLVVQKKNYKQY